MSPLRPDQRGDLNVLLGAALWSTGGVCVKLLGGLHPAGVSAGRSLICTVLFLVILRGRIAVRRADLRVVVFASICYACVTTTFVISSRWTTAANAILLQYTAPLWIALHGWLIRRQRPTRGEFAALGFGFAGIALCATEDLSIFRAAERGLLGLAGDGIALLSGVFFAALTIALRRVKRVEPEGTSPSASPALLILVYGNLLSGLVGGFALWGQIGDAWTLGQPRVVGWLILLWMGAGQLGGGYWFFQRGLRTTRALTASLLGLIEPILNPLWVALLVEEFPGLGTWAGGALVMISVVLSITARPRPE